MVYRMNFAYSRSHARQMITHGHFRVNGRKVTIPSFVVRVNDEIAFGEKSKKSEHVKTMMEDLQGLVEVPEWILVDGENFSAKVNSAPTREDVSIDVEEHLIVELYSK